MSRDPNSGKRGPAAGMILIRSPRRRRDERRRQFEAGRLGGGQVDDEIEFGRQLRRLLRAEAIGDFARLSLALTVIEPGAGSIGSTFARARWSPELWREALTIAVYFFES